MIEVLLWWCGIGTLLLPLIFRLYSNGPLWMVILAAVVSGPLGFSFCCGACWALQVVGTGLRAKGVALSELVSESEKDAADD